VRERERQLEEEREQAALDLQVERAARQASRSPKKGHKK